MHRARPGFACRSLEFTLNSEGANPMDTIVCNIPGMKKLWPETITHQELSNGKTIKLRLTV